MLLPKTLFLPAWFPLNFAKKPIKNRRLSSFAPFKLLSSWKAVCFHCCFQGQTGIWYVDIMFNLKNKHAQDNQSYEAWLKRKFHLGLQHRQSLWKVGSIMGLSSVTSRSPPPPPPPPRIIRSRITFLCEIPYPRRHRFVLSTLILKKIDFRTLLWTLSQAYCKKCKEWIFVRFIRTTGVEL